MLFLGAIPLQEAYAAINLDVIFFLLGMFSVVAAMDLSGLLEYFTLRMLELAKSPQRAFALVLFGMSVMSAFLVNDTLVGRHAHYAGPGKTDAHQARGPAHYSRNGSHHR